MRGRPSKYKTSQELEALIEKYFKTKGVKTITGLALHLGFTSRQAIMNYEHKDEFVDAIKRAKLRIEQYYEERLSSPYATGAIFALKNFKWSDKQEIEHSGNVINPQVIIKLNDTKG